jgi:Na+/melibiose symporter-like transporter
MKPVYQNTIPSVTGRFGFADSIKVALFGFAINFLWTPMSGIVMPLVMLNFVPESQKNTDLGLVTFVGLILAMFVQPLAGAVSDRYGSSRGRRRPFILGGSLAAVVLLMLLGIANGIILVLIMYCLLQISSNVAHGPWQGLIPDLVPANKRGIASAVKGVLETLGSVTGLGVAGYFLSERFVADANIKLLITLGIISTVIIAFALATVLLVKEKPSPGRAVISFLKFFKNVFKIESNISTNFIYFLLSRFLFLMPLIVVRTFGLYYLRDVADVPDPVAAASDLMMAVGISLLIVIYPAGHFSDRFGRRLILTASGILAAIAFMVLIYFHTYCAIIATGVLLGIANGCFMSANWALATDLVSEG